MLFNCPNSVTDFLNNGFDELKVARGRKRDWWGWFWTWVFFYWPYANGLSHPSGA